MSEAVAKSIIAHGRPEELPQPMHTSRTIIAPSTGVWEDIRSMFTARPNGDSPAIVQRLESNGYTNTAFALSLLASLFPHFPKTDSQPQESPLSGLQKTTNIYSMPVVSRPKGGKRLVLRRALHSDLEESKGLAVIAHDAYWEEHQRRHPEQQN